MPEEDVRDFALDRAEALWNPRGQPQILTHFTDATAKQSILESGVLRATRLEGVQHRGDRMEWRLGWGILNTAMEGFAEGSESPIANRVAQRFREDEGPFKSVYHANVACFTEAPELEATQKWFHEMGKNETIDFDVKSQLVAATKERRNRKIGIRLWPVVYSVDHLLDAAKTLIGEVIQRVERQGEENAQLRMESLASRAFFALRTPFTAMGLAYKRPKFQVEAEWRLIATGLRPEGESGPSSRPDPERYEKLHIPGLAGGDS